MEKLFEELKKESYQKLLIFRIINSSKGFYKKVFDRFYNQNKIDSYSIKLDPKPRFTFNAEVNF